MGNLVEQVARLVEPVDFGVEENEFRGEEIVGRDGGEDDAGMKLLGLAMEDAVGAVLEEVAVRSIVEVAGWCGRVQILQCLLKFGGGGAR